MKFQSSKFPNLRFVKETGNGVLIPGDSYVKTVSGNWDATIKEIVGAVLKQT